MPLICRWLMYLAAFIGIAGPVGASPLWSRPHAPHFSAGAAAVPVVIGGEAVDPSDWPSVFEFTTLSGSCTATLVGPRALITSALCIGKNGEGSIQLSDGRVTTVRCDAAPHYRDDESADYALCLTLAPVEGIAYESVNTDPDFLKRESTLTLTGYGCADPDGKSDYVLRIGEATVVALPDPQDTNPNYIVLRGKAAICFGDGGGGAFAVDAAGTRKLVGLNSKGNIRDLSFIAATSTEAASEFFKEWTSLRGTAICGYSADATGCRN